MQSSILYMYIVRVSIGLKYSDIWVGVNSIQSSQPNNIFPFSRET